MGKYFIIIILFIGSSFNLLSQTFYSQMAAQYAAEGNYEKAIELEKEGLEMWERIHGKENERYANSLNKIAQYYSELSLYLNAIKNEEEAIDIIIKLKGKNNDSYVSFLSNLSQYKYLLGNFKEAIQIQLEAYNIEKELYGCNSPRLESSLNNLTVYYQEDGNYHKALTTALNCLEIQNNNRSSQLEISTTLSNISLIYADLHNLQDAIFYIKESLRYDSIQGKGICDDNYRTGLSNLASYYSEIGNHNEAIKIGKQVLDGDSLFGKINSLNYLISLNNLAVYEYNAKNYSSSINHSYKALQIEHNNFGIKHSLYSVILNNILNCFLTINDLETALKISEELIANRKVLYGEEHQKYINAITNHLIIQWYKKDFKKVEELMDITNPFHLTFIRRHFNFLPYSSRKNYFSQFKYWFTQYIPLFVFSFESRKLIKVAYDNSLSLKGILLNSEIEFDQFIRETGNEELPEKYNEIKMLRLQLNKLYEKPIAERFCDTDSLERHVNELERKLMDESSEYGDYTKNLSVTWEEVQKGLGKKDAAIEFVHFPLNQDSTMYMAYILRPEMESPAMVKLFEEKELKGVNEETLYSSVEGSKLVWEKLQSELEGVENIYFSPDGILHQIAIEYFPDYADSTRLISDRYRLNRLTSTRQLALKRDKGKTEKAIVYGGISYDTDPDIMETESRKYDRGNTRGIESYYNVADSLSGLRSGVKYLQFTMKEAEKINDLLSSGHYSPMIRSGNEATEESFKSLSGTRPGIMHIATHGFYWEEEEADRQAKMNERLLFMSQFGDNARRNVEDKALTRTGLFMAGANNALSGKEIPEDIDDGILTASEIANLDLRGTDLVVLSACRTGMGDIGGDGVFGLQRGFKKGGVNSILMSLWDVDDEATQILMTSFYQNYLKGMTKQEALLEAQKTVRVTPGFSDPEYWAAFILLDALN